MQSFNICNKREMSIINSFNIKNFRNILSATFNFTDKINLIVGNNGSGKSSILEAIYSLASGRSFRGNIHNAINFQATEYVLNATINADMLAIGATRRKDGTKMYKLQHKGVKILEIAQFLPLQFINVHAEELLHGEVKLRQRYLDWLLFHVEPTFIQTWKNFLKCLQQRNALLKQLTFSSYLQEELNSWNNEFVTLSNTINNLRKNMLVQIMPTITQCLYEYFKIDGITVDYYPGWKSNDLLKDLNDNHKNDLLAGFTSIGPHRGDLLINWYNCPAKQVLSRGQQKLLAMCFFLARARWLRDNTSILGIFLIDDFGSELDLKATNVLISALEALKSQVIATSLTPCQSLRQASMFHVEHGVVN